MLYLLDTNIVSALARECSRSWASPGWRKVAGLARGSIAISSIVHAEVLYGFAKRPSPRREREYRWVRQQAPVLDWRVDSGVVERFATLRAHLERRREPLDAMDLLIAAQALALDATLVSNDRGFLRVPELRLENWLEPAPPAVHEPGVRWPLR